jgi:hypothetical protein
MVGTEQRLAAHAELLTSLGMSLADASRLLARRTIDVAEAQHLVRELGCPPSLAADILLWADELETLRP